MANEIKDKIANIRTEQPNPAAAALATQHGLGNWADTLATKQGFGSKNRDWRLYFFKDGIVVTAPDGYAAAYDWGTLRILQYRRTINGGDADTCSVLIN